MTRSTPAYFALAVPDTPWTGRAVALLVAGCAFVLYAWTAAPGITWAHQGADSGELLAAAMTNGVPHPPGYPLYTMLLRGWIELLGVLGPGSDIGWRGSLLSALCGAAAAGFTVTAIGAALAGVQRRWLWAGVAGLAWAIAPLPWTQSILTEVYALHMLALAALGWALLSHPRNPWLAAPVVALGAAHHLTFVLLMPASLYWIWSQSEGLRSRGFWRMFAALAAGGLVGTLFHVRTPLAAGALPPPPVNWGYPDNWEGFWWLVSGAAYRGYFFSMSLSGVWGRLATWANTITAQYSPVGLALAVVGLGYQDSAHPKQRTFGLFWILPVSIYSISYYTRDSEIYLLPVVWMCALWLAWGLAVGADWLEGKFERVGAAVLLGVVVAGMAGLLVWRTPQLSLRHDSQAKTFLADALAVLEPGSVVVTGDDKETFAIWYGAWGSGELLEAAPDAIVVNYSLFQFDWYRRLLRALYPDAPGVEGGFASFLEANAAQRPVFFTAILGGIPAEQFSAAGPLWRYTP